MSKRFKPSTNDPDEENKCSGNVSQPEEPDTTNPPNLDINSDEKTVSSGSSTDTASETNKLDNLDVGVDFETLIPGNSCYYFLPKTSDFDRKTVTTLSKVTADGTVIIENIPAKLPNNDSDAGWYDLEIFPDASISFVEEVLKDLETSAEQEKDVDVVGEWRGQGVMLSAETTTNDCSVIPKVKFSCFVITSYDQD